MKYDTEILKALGDKVRTMRESQGLTQDGLAQKASFHRTYIGSIERGERNVSLLNLQRLSYALGVSVSSLFWNVEYNNNKTGDADLAPRASVR